MRPRRTIAVAALAGIAAGTTAAAVGSGDEPAAPRQQPITSATKAPPLPAGPPRGRLSDGSYNPSFLHYRVRNRRVAVRVPDPAGGPPWVVATFDADVLKLARPTRTLRGARVVSRRRCAQLGRWSDGRFGWVFPAGRFRPTGVEERVLLCHERGRTAPAAAFETVLALPTPAAPRVSATVAWGVVPGATAVRIAGTGEPQAAARVGARGAFLSVGGPTATATNATATATTRDRTVRLPLGPPRPRIPGPRIVAGSERVEARAPDPAGGPGYGLLVARGEDGEVCVGGAGGRAVGDRLGDVDMRLGLFWASVAYRADCRFSAPPPTRARPCEVATGYGDAEELEADDAFLRRARTERRLLPGRTTITARCIAAVEQVTLRTPRDIRTLVPSPTAHAVLAVYDGGFPAGELELTARLRDGTTHRARIPLGL